MNSIKSVAEHLIRSKVRPGCTESLDLFTPTSIGVVESVEADYSGSIFFNGDFIVDEENYIDVAQLETQDLFNIYENIND